MPVVIVFAFAAFLLKLLLATARVLHLAGQLYQRAKKYLWLRSFYPWLFLGDREDDPRLKTLPYGEWVNYSTRVAGMAL